MEQFSLFDVLLDGLAAGDKSADEIEEFVLAQSDYLNLADQVLVGSIQEAFNLSRGGRSFSQKRSTEAWQWIEEDLAIGKGHPFSFRSCCMAAGVDPEELQERLLFMRYHEKFAV